MRNLTVGRVLGRENLAAVGFCFQINLILVALSMGLTLPFLPFMVFSYYISPVFSGFPFLLTVPK